MVGEMTQWLKPLPCKHKDQRSDPQNWVNLDGCGGLPVIPASQGIPQSKLASDWLYGSALSLSERLSFSG